MAKMNWNRVRLENLIARYGRTDFRIDPAGREFTGAGPRIATRRNSGDKRNKDRRAEIRRMVNQMDDAEFAKFEHVVERWITTAPDREVAELLSKFDADLSYLFQVILEKMTKRQEEWFESLQRLSSKWRRSRTMRKTLDKVGKPRS